MRPVPGLLAVCIVSAVVAAGVTTASLLMRKAIPLQPVTQVVPVSVVTEQVPCGTDRRCQVGPNTFVNCTAIDLLCRRANTATGGGQQATYCGCVVASIGGVGDSCGVKRGNPRRCASAAFPNRGSNSVQCASGLCLARTPSSNDCYCR